MHKALPLIISIILSTFAAERAWAATLTVVECSQCRDVYTYPGDYANHAYNQVFGSNPTLSFLEGDIMRVVAPNGQWAVVDLNFVFQPTGISFNLSFLSYAVTIPSGRIQMTVQDPRGAITEFQAFALSPDLLVGDGTAGSSVTEPVEEPPPETQKASTHSGGQEIVCCQSGAFYWYYDQPAFQFQFGSE